MKRKELKILGLSYSQTQIGSYVIVLSEKGGKRKLPLIIKANDAQRIALEIEGIKPNRPQIHDIIKSLGDIVGFDIQEVFIHNLAEGVFYTKLIVHNGIEEFEIESSAGDAIALAVLYKAPIYVNLTVLDSAGIFINDDGSPMTDDEVDNMEVEDVDIEDESTIRDRVVSVEDLEIMMQQAIENEEYEIAAELRDRITQLKG